jgi:DnaK suppressor protein
MAQQTLSALHVPPEVPLSVDEVTALRAMLEEQRAFRIDQLTELHHPERRSPLGTSDPEIFRSLSAGARAALRDVQAALWRIEDGTYGLCIDCQEPIPVERLEILPQTAVCLACHRSARA